MRPRDFPSERERERRAELGLCVRRAMCVCVCVSEGGSGRGALGVTGRGTARHVSTVGNGFLRRRNVCYSSLASTFVSITVTCYPATATPQLPHAPALVTRRQRIFMTQKRVHNASYLVRVQCCTTHTHTQRGHTVAIQQCGNTHRLAFALIFDISIELCQL